MKLWKICTLENPSGHYVRGKFTEKQIRERMFEYIREKRKQGFGLCQIMYTYHEVYTQNQLP